MRSSITARSTVLSSRDRVLLTIRPVGEHSTSVEDLLDAGFEPARTPYDRLTRDSTIADPFISDALCFAQLQPAALAWFLGFA